MFLIKSYKVFFPKRDIIQKNVSGKIDRILRERKDISSYNLVIKSFLKAM